MDIQKKNESGITLIILTITVLVMIILASVSVKIILDENGIVEQAQYAKIASEDKEWNEKALIILTSASAWRDNIEELTASEEASAGGDVTILEELRKQKMIKYLKNEFEEKNKNEEVTVTSDGDGYLINVGEKQLKIDKNLKIIQ